MKYLKLFESVDEKGIRKICKKYYIKNYTINNDGSIDVDDNVEIWQNSLTEIPLKFNKVNGGFSCSYNYLTSFQYAPKIIRGNFNCEGNNIKSFEYFPSFVKGYFDCVYNLIFQVWKLFGDTTKIELLNDFDIFRDEDTNTPVIIMDRLNDFLLTIGLKQVKEVKGYKNI